MTFSLKRAALKVGFLSALSLFAPPSLAQVYNGPGLEEGAANAGVAGIATAVDPRQVIAGVVNTALSYTALAAVITIIIAGYYLIFSLGNDANKETAKKIIIYTSVGLAVILLAKAIVFFVIDAFW